jgi:uncharacterized protein YceH (UPF0502 family)
MKPAPFWISRESSLTALACSHRALRWGTHGCVNPDPDNDAGASSIPLLAPLEARMIGAMIEKALATPQNYPLSLNALMTACNQTTNRDPITHYSEGEILDVLAHLKERGLLRFVHPTSGRGVTKYRQVIHEALGLEDSDIALLSVLLVRGPQTSGELRTRTERLHSFDSPNEIEQRLGDMTTPDGEPLAQLLDREAGHREARWIQLLSSDQGLDRAMGPPSAPSPAVTGNQVSELEALRSDLAALRAEFETFRAQFR